MGGGGRLRSHQEAFKILSHKMAATVDHLVPVTSHQTEAPVYPVTTAAVLPLLPVLSLRLAGREIYGLYLHMSDYSPCNHGSLSVGYLEYVLTIQN